VVTVSVAVEAAVPLMATDAGTLQVGGSVGLVIAVVTAQERFTVPVKPFEGATVMVAELPLVAP